MKDVFLWAVALGHSRHERRPLSGKRVIVFRWAQFGPQMDIPMLKAIAIADTRGVDALLAQDQILIIVEEYANAGIHELGTNLLREDGRPLWNLISQIGEVNNGG